MEKLLREVSVFIRRRRPALPSTFKRLTQGQNPIALLLACSDSRVVPGLLLSADPGDVFVIVGACIAPPSASMGAATAAEDRTARVSVKAHRRNTRLEFKAVTGISTGAVIAPFAFLGSRRDKQSREVYTLG